MLLGYGYMRNSLVRLGGYPTHRDVAGKYLLFLFCVYTITGMARLPISRYSKRNGMNKNRYKLQAACRDENYANAHVPT